MPSRQFIVLALGVFAWLAATATGFVALQRYAATDGAAEQPSAAVDAFLAVHRRPGRALLVMAVHPRCPCTNASLGELGDLLARSAGACDALLVQYEPETPPPDWPRDTTPHMLGGRPVNVILDRDGQIAARLGARTSGHVVFADANGAVRFHGGLTLARGHRGRSPGQDTILAALRGDRPQLTAAPVYGCALETVCQTALR